MSYHIGKYAIDSQTNRGWFIGTFMENAATKTDAVEVKYSEFPVGMTDHPMKISATYECVLLIEGKVRAIVDGHEVIMSAGDYLAVQPSVPSNSVVEILEPAKIFTIKAPSDPTAKEVIG